MKHASTKHLLMNQFVRQISHCDCVPRHTVIDIVGIACQSQLPGAACTHAPAQIGVAAQQLRFSDDVLGDFQRRDNVIERDPCFDL